MAVERQLKLYMGLIENLRRVADHQYFSLPLF
jgi:hypothetical protein